MRVNRSYLITAASALIVSCIFYIGHFLLGKKSPGNDTGKTTTETTAETAAQTGKHTDPGRISESTTVEVNGADTAIEDAVKHERIETEIGGRKQVINLLEIKLDSGAAAVKPALSFDMIFGFEKLSEIAERSGAYAAVNGGFFSVYGEPAGMVMVDGELFTASNGKYPVFVTDGEKAEFKDIKTELKITVNGVPVSVDKINIEGAAGLTVMYTPRYGSSNRANSLNKTYIIENGKVIDVVTGEGETSIPKNGILLTKYFPEEAIPGESNSGSKKWLDLKLGDLIAYDRSFNLGSSVSAYECGCMILKDGVDVSGTSDPWIGVLTNWDPRTVIGLKDENTVVLMTVDGRQGGYSSGLTASETAKFLKSIGVTDAAMLDGGASTEMFVNGKTVNRPSNNGEGRKIAGAVVVVEVIDKN